MNFLKNYIKTLISLLKIKYISSKNQKNIIFYFPIKIYQKNLITISKKLSQKNQIFMVYNEKSINEIINLPSSLYIEFNYLKYIPLSNYFLKNIHLFISSYLNYVYPPNSKNIYISHDIYDAPMINHKDEKKLFLRINKLDYIFASSNLSKNYFLSKFNKYNIKSNPVIINTGYLKLDHIIDRLNNYKKKSYKNGICIVLSPGYFGAYKQFNMKNNINKIIHVILKNKEINLIFRPHPLELTKKGDYKFIEEILDKYRNFKNFKANLNISYLKQFNKSDIMITDLSSIAYTYAFSTNKPVIFFSYNEKNLKKETYFKSNYFKDRLKLGRIITKEDELIKSIKILKQNQEAYKNNIKKLRKIKIENLNKSKKITINTIQNIISSTKSII